MTLKYMSFNTHSPHNYPQLQIYCLVVVYILNFLVTDETQEDKRHQMTQRHYIASSAIHRRGGNKTASRRSASG